MAKLLGSKHYRVSCDPGITGTGLALWHSKTWEQPVAPIETLNLYPKRLTGAGSDFFPIGSRAPETRWLPKAHSVSSQVHEYLESFKPTHFYCEQPEFFANETGQMVATTGDLIKLVFVVGCFARSCWELGIEFVPIPVKKWKGQLSKEIVERRIRKDIPGVETMEIKSHSWDAVGIGLFAKGFFS